MKRNEFTDTKALDIKTLKEKSKKLGLEISELILDKNMNKLKDLKTIGKKRKDLAQVLTVLRQKELLEALESIDEIKIENSKGKNESKKTKVDENQKEVKTSN